MTQEELKEVNKKISELVKKAYAALSEAERLSDETGIPFNFDPAYGMGGTYHPPKAKAVEAGEVDEDDSWYEEGWVSSSQNC